MGRMKEIYINIINEYGEMPDGFSLTEYLHEKKKGNDEYRDCLENKETLSREEISQRNDSMDKGRQANP
jgi:hypothetical protein